MEGQYLFSSGGELEGSFGFYARFIAGQIECGITTPTHRWVAYIPRIDINVWSRYKSCSFSADINYILKGSFILEQELRGFRWVHRESNLMFTLNSDKDHRKIAFVLILLDPYCRTWCGDHFKSEEICYGTLRSCHFYT